MIELRCRACRQDFKIPRELYEKYAEILVEIAKLFNIKMEKNTPIIGALLLKVADNISLCCPIPDVYFIKSPDIQ